jgi:uncharacterized protein YbjT (DUF2867 family)
MAERQIMAIVGATGAQGGGLARAVLADRSGRFTARAITRHPDSGKARALAAMGAEVVAADADDPPSMARAFAGAQAAFCVTNYWEHLSPERELAQARAQADAARAAGIGHVIWSTLEDTRRWVPLDDDRMPTLMGRYKVPHFDAKGEADAFFEGLPVTYLLTSFYWDNLIYFGMGPRREADGSLSFVLPMGDEKLPGIAAEDIGKCAYGVFKRGKELIGRAVGIAGGHLSGAEMAAGLSRVLGEPVRHVNLPFETYRQLGFPGADDLGNMFQYNHDFATDFRRPRDIAFARELNPELMTFDAWLDAHKDEIPIQTS